VRDRGGQINRVLAALEAAREAPEPKPLAPVAQEPYAASAQLPMKKARPCGQKLSNLVSGSGF
jgi:hypothetical protein